jgi:hypothetical protein
MGHAVWFVGLLGFVAAAFGMAAAQTLARCIAVGLLCLLAMLAFDIATRGALSDLVPRGRPNQPFERLH